MNLNAKNVLIMGLGKSGISALNLLYNKESTFYLYDQKEEALKTASEFINRMPNAFCVKNVDDKILEDINLIILSPGINKENEIIIKAKAKNITVMSELELGYLSCKNKFLCVTGTNGKTTVSCLLGHILKTAKKRVSVVGNVGIPVTSKINKHTKHDAFVCEVSSFQLDTSERFRPHIAAVLNIREDHLDYHKTMQNYIDAKYKIAKFMAKKDHLVLNENCKITKKLKDSAHCSIYFFNTKKECFGSFIKNGEVIINIKKPVQIMSIKQIPFLGEHNKENVLCAALMAYLCGIKPKFIKQGVMSFKLPPHRIETIAEANGAEYIDDSKATNVDSTVAAVKAMTKPTYLILGGSDKGYDFDILFKNLTEKIKECAVCGATADKLMASAQKLGYKNITKFNTLKEAVTYCFNKVKVGECVLLSPANASFDEFKNYVDRAEHFKAYIEELQASGNQVRGKR